MLRYALRKTTFWEVVTPFLSLASFIASFIPAFTSNTQYPTQLVLWATSAGAVLWFALLATRASFTVVGYRNVMTLLRQLARVSRHRVWTVRTHVGDGASEEDYFRTIEARLADSDNGLEDYRRLFRLAPAARGHALTLIDKCLREEAAEVRFFKGGGPQFDFVIFDDVAIIGMPMAGGRGNVGAVVLRGAVVEAVAGVFLQLWNAPDTVPLFKGGSESPEERRAQAIATLDRELSGLSSGTRRLDA